MGACVGVLIPKKRRIAQSEPLIRNKASATGTCEMMPTDAKTTAKTMNIADARKAADRVISIASDFSKNVPETREFPPVNSILP
jgi:copper(I)-binding protein